MSFSVRCLPAVLLTILSLPTSLWAQGAPKEVIKTPRGSVSGRVTIKEKGVFGVAVALRSFANANERIPRGITDQDGFYRIANVAPGAYEASPSTPAFVPTDSKESRGKTVLVGEAENVENIDFTLVRGGVITGRVTDADSRPVIQQQVYVYRADAFEQRRAQPAPQVYGAGGAPTDDRGIYRVFGLLPGRYKVAAGRSDTAFSGGIGLGRSAYIQVFHPDATDQAKATVIEVGEGTEATNVDITLGRPLQTFTAAGRVVDGEKGLPVPNIRLVLQRQVGQRVEFVNTVSLSGAEGDFVATGLIPGKYGVFLFSNESTGRRVETLTFDVIDQDVSGITIKLIEGASLSGVVIVETENKAVITKLFETRLQAMVANPRGTGGGGIGSSATSPIAADGSFYLSGLPGGMVNLTLSSATNPQPPKGFGIARIEHDGVVGMRGIQLKDGEHLTGIRVVLSYGNATLRGVVNVENGPLPPGARIWVNLFKAGERPGNIRPSPVDARGHFLMEGIPAGTYEVRATVVEAPQVASPRVAKREITLQDGVITDVTLSIEMSEPQKP
ncbi:MAG TPA: hypothetical protein VGC73_02490 [Pyrinomonadaceae bacterium]